MHFWFDAIILGWCIMYIEWSQVILKTIPNRNIILLSLVFFLVLGNRVDPDEWTHYVVFLKCSGSVVECLTLDRGTAS